MKKLTYIILIIVIPLIAMAHEDTYFEYTYDNVIVRFETGYYIEEIENAKLIGQYASILCDIMAYEEPVLLDFIHDYGHSYEGENYSYIDYGHGSYDLVSYYTPKFDTSLNHEVYYPVDYKDPELLSLEKVEKKVYTILGVNKSKKIIVRQFGFNFDIKSTINMLHYALSNKSRLKSEIIPDTLHSYLHNMYYVLNTIPKFKVDSIMQHSPKIVDKTLGNKVYRQADSIHPNTIYYSYYSKRNKYFIFGGIHNKEVILDSLNHIFSFEITPYFIKYLFVFETPQTMRVFHGAMWNDEFISSQSHSISVSQFEYITSTSIEYLGDDIYMIDYNRSILMSPFKRYLYLANDDILITDFESYIDSWRKKDE